MAAALLDRPADQPAAAERVFVPPEEDDDGPSTPPPPAARFAPPPRVDEATGLLEGVKKNRLTDKAKKETEEDEDEGQGDAEPVSKRVKKVAVPFHRRPCATTKVCVRTCVGLGFWGGKPYCNILLRGGGGVKGEVWGGRCRDGSTRARDRSVRFGSSEGAMAEMGGGGGRHLMREAARRCYIWLRFQSLRQNYQRPADHVFFFSPLFLTTRRSRELCTRNSPLGTDIRRPFLFSSFYLLLLSPAPITPVTSRG